MRNFLFVFSFLSVFTSISATISLTTSVSAQPPKKFSEKTSGEIKEELSKLTTSAAKEKRKKGQMLPTAPQFSGAFQWAHKEGITGKAQIGVIIEGVGESEIIRTEDLKEPSIPQSTHSFRGSSPTKKQEQNLIDIYSEGDASAHEISTTNTLHQIAPDSIIMRVKDQSNLDLSKGKKYIFDHARVLSHSAGIHKSYWGKAISTTSLPNNFLSWKEFIQHFDSRYLSFYKRLTAEAGALRLFFQSAGNEGINLSTSFQTPEGESIYEQIKTFLEDTEFQRHLIVVGTVNQYFLNVHNYPGEDTLIQENFLCTLGENVRVLGKKGYTLQSGTSLATPIAAGAALLLMQEFPSFNIFQIKEVLLESAAQNFMIQGRVSSDKVDIIFVYDPKDGPPNLEKLKDPYGLHGWVENYDISTQPFDPKKYGKGILDLRAAFVYAKLKEGYSSWSKEHLRDVMKDIIAGEEEDAATQIQASFRRYRERKNKSPHSLKVKAS